MKKLFFIHITTGFLIFLFGCDKSTEVMNRDSLTLAELAGEAYQPAKVSFLPLTEIVAAQGPDKPGKIAAYVNLTDSAGAAIKYPGVFRFELYEYMQDLIEPKGKRLAIWEDQDLTAFADNNSAWRDFLRAYQFDLAFKADTDIKYVLEVTFISPKEKYLTNQITIPTN
jgi:hypothetical protein